MSQKEEKINKYGKRNSKGSSLSARNTQHSKVHIFGRVSFEQKVLFAKHLSVMLRSGLTITEAIDISRDASSGAFARVLKSVLASVTAGNMLSSSLEEHPHVFSGLFVNVIRAGEMSGTLDENLENLAAELQKEKDLRNKILGALLYPIIILVATIGLGLALSFIVLPKIIPLFQGLSVDLPFSTRMLIEFSRFVEENTILLLSSIIAGIVLFVWTIRQKFSQPITHWILMELPIVSRVVRGANLARTALTLGLLLKSGFNTDEALETTANTVTNFYFRRALHKAAVRIRAGTTLAENLEDYPALFPRVVTRMIKVGEESGRLPDTCFYLSEFYESDVDTATKSLSTAIEPILLLVIGGMVGFLALSIITPIYDITGNIRR
jgi:type IV pilus assembly protein PilC